MDHEVRWEETMLIAEAQVDTERPGRYLVQLCQHVSLFAQANPQMGARAEWSDNHGVIHFGSGRCVLNADAGVLTLRAEAPDAETLTELQQRIAGRLEQIGRRDRLTVTWAPRQGTDTGPTGRPTDVRPHKRGDMHD